MPRASAADAAATAARILDLATERFSAHGYAAASVDDIARAAGVTRGAVYHHYSSKAGLFAAVAAAQQQVVADRIVAAALFGDAVRALRDGSHAFLDAITQGPAARILLVDAPAVLSWTEWRRLDAAGPLAHLQEGLREAGVMPAQRPALAAALSGAMNELALWLSEQADAGACVQAHEALDRLLDAIPSGPASPPRDQ